MPLVMPPTWQSLEIIEHDDEILRELGLMTILVSYLEAELEVLHASLSGISRYNANLQYRAVKNFNERLKKVSQYAESATLSQSDQKAVSKLLERAGRLARRRNKAVHGVWSWDEDAKNRYYLLLSKGKMETVNADYMRRLNKDYKLLIADIRSHLRAQDMENLSYDQEPLL
jgi:hypothetical protein